MQAALIRFDTISGQLMEKWQEQFARSAFERAGEIAHDLKTPLNVAVLNLELLRMRIRKVCGEDDERVVEYARSIEAELRRMGKIYDAFFVNAAPPRNSEAPSEVDFVPTVRSELEKAKLPSALDGKVIVMCHASRLSEACRLLAEGCSKSLVRENVSVEQEVTPAATLLRISGEPASSEFEIGKIFKFYYTDPSGSPDLSLATARLIFETYGLRLDVREEPNRVVFELAVPTGEK